MSHYASIVQKKAMELAQAYFADRFKTYLNVPMLQVQPGDLPILGVYILRERRNEDGHANHTEPHFKHQLTLGFSGGAHVDTDMPNQNAHPALEEMMSELDDVLLSEPDFIKLTEGIISMDRVAQFAKVGETTLYEIRVEMTLEFSSRWPPRVPDMLEEIVVTTKYPMDAEPGSTIEIKRVYEIEVDT